jgi:hypothetical protein
MSPTWSCSSSGSTATWSGCFTYVVETERRFYLCNQVDMQVPHRGAARSSTSSPWPTSGSWDIYRSSRFVRSVRVVTFKDVNIEELAKPDIALP